MNMNRLRPVGVKKEDLALWLSGIVNDAIKDAVEAGLDKTSAILILRNLDEMWGGRYVTSPFEDLGKKKGSPT